MRYFFCLWLLPLLSVAQFAPPVGQAGTTAMYKDSSAFINWATFCNVTRGYQDISTPSLGYATIGDSSKALGKADNSLVSLGDAGYAICTFQNPITDGPGPDLAVFENSFNDDYLELAFVEVSSDGINFFRFPATSNTQDTLQTGSFGSTDATLINNLAGKYRGMYGTPFDLQELQGVGGLNINAITHVKIIDVVGSITPTYATFDQNGRRVNDPWSTAFPSSGFDLDALGVIHDITNSIMENKENDLSIFPNPSGGVSKLKLTIRNEDLKNKGEIRISDALGREIKREKIVLEGDLAFCDVGQLPPGVYFFNIGICVKKVIITQ